MIFPAKLDLFGFCVVMYSRRRKNDLPSHGHRAFPKEYNRLDKNAMGRSYKGFLLKFCLTSLLCISLIFATSVFHYFIEPPVIRVYPNRALYAELITGRSAFQLQVPKREKFAFFSEFLDRSGFSNHSQTEKVKVCFVTFSLVGPTKNGGLATATTAMAEELAKNGYDVTVLYLWGQNVQSGSISFWRKVYEEKGVKVVALPAFRRFALSPASDSKYIRLSYEAYLWLKDHHFDVIHFHEWHGQGYYATLAKHQGLHFQRTLLVTTIHCPSLFFLQGSSMMLKSFNYLSSDFLERKQVYHSDVVLSPSAFMLNWVQGNGWELPEDTFLQQNILSSAVRNLKQSKTNYPHSSEKIYVKEFVYFGRIEVLKGVFQFCDALDILAGEVLSGSLRNFKVTFMGNGNLGSGKNVTSFLYDRAKKGRWPFDVKVETSFLQDKAVQYLTQSAGRVAVMPSLVENSPYAVLESLYLEVPFLCSNVGGIPELISSLQHDKILFEPNAVGISEALRNAVMHGMQLIIPAVDSELNRRLWVASHDRLVHQHMLAEIKPTFYESVDILVSVCMPHHNRGKMILHTLDALCKQDHKKLELIVVDDGSDDQGALELLKDVHGVYEKCFHRFEIIYQENLFPGAARNHAVREARGIFVAFIDDDDVPKTNWVSTMLRVALNTKADVVTHMCDFFKGWEAPSDTQRPDRRWVTLGPAVELGLFDNVFGAYSAMVNRDSFWKIGGFSEDKESTFEDYEFFARSVLEGFRLEMVPEALMWYRQNPDKHLMRSTDRVQNRMRAIRPYLQKIPPELQKAVLFAYGNVKKTGRRS